VSIDRVCQVCARTDVLVPNFGVKIGRSVQVNHTQVVVKKTLGFSGTAEPYFFTSQIFELIGEIGKQVKLSIL